jgi:preprotein translocase subunit SecG
MFTLLLVFQVIVAITLITLVLLQHGKGADMGAAFGSGASTTVFGARGSGSFFTRATAILAALFFVNCLLLASPLVRHGARPGSVVEQVAPPAASPDAGVAGDANVIEEEPVAPPAPSDLPDLQPEPQSAGSETTPPAGAAPVTDTGSGEPASGSSDLPE